VEHRDTTSLGERIAAARNRARLTQAELAAAVGLDRSALTKIEGGTRRVTALELAAIADAVGERFEWLLSDPPPAILAHRNLAEPGAPSATIDRVVERAAREVEFLQAHDDKWNLADQKPLPRPASVHTAEKSAAAVRSLLGLDDSQPALDVSHLATRIGLLVFSLDLGTDAADAASVLLRRGGVAVVNGSRATGRRRLAIAHEVGHYVFADGYTVDWRIAEQDDDAAWESRLDRFARALLLPERGLRAAWADAVERHGDLRPAAVVVASRFRVDMSTLSRRLAELQLAPREETDRVRAMRTTKADIVELSLVVADEATAPGLPRPYAESILRLYRQEMISAERAIGLLLDTWTEDELPELPSLPESAIWDFVS
jgi:Zn-dependent peptidase ImmA (M78 family)/DNA-binding XRE family transcriptional regulator